MSIHACIFWCPIFLGSINDLKMCKTFFTFFTTFNYACLQEGRETSHFLYPIFLNIIHNLSFADILTTEVPPLSCADNNLTTEEHEECGKDVCKPNAADVIPAGKIFKCTYSTNFWYYLLNFLGQCYYRLDFQPFCEPAFLASHQLGGG